MNRSRPGVLSVRAVNQYRRRDVLTYLGLRYYLDNTAARTDQWAREVAPHLVLTRSEPPYFRALHFKESTQDGNVEYRPVFLPGANEALAEAALLDECVKHSNVFSNPDCVFSYQLCIGGNRKGIFQPYFGGLQRRHQAIADACDAYPNGQVLYIDIKRFYPSIQLELALGVWRKHAEMAGLAQKWQDLGNRLIQDHAKAGSDDGKGVLTGPMFSHLLGNLVLRELDEACLMELPARYFRYVDDITLVGDADAVERSLTVIRRYLADLGFELHDEESPKTIRVPAQEWLKGRNDFHESRREISWMTLIGDLKKFLLQNPEENRNLNDAFRNEGFRIPVRDYSQAIYEASYLEWMRRWSRNSWFRGKSHVVTIDSLLNQARCLRKIYGEEFQELMEDIGRLDPFNRKRRIPKLRYRAARLIYLATDETLQSVYPIAGELPELHFHAEVMSAVATGEIDRILSMGSNAAQAAAQPMRAMKIIATTHLQSLSQANEQALSVFALNGVRIEHPEIAEREYSELAQFSEIGADINLMKHGQPFMRELACLHGLKEETRHPQMLETVFDEDEALAMDAIEQLQQSVSA